MTLAWSRTLRRFSLLPLVTSVMCSCSRPSCWVLYSHVTFTPPGRRDDRIPQFCFVLFFSSRDIADILLRRRCKSRAAVWYQPSAVELMQLTRTLVDLRVGEEEGRVERSFPRVGRSGRVKTIS